jgi:hypothetical protein
MESQIPLATRPTICPTRFPVGERAAFSLRSTRFQDGPQPQSFQYHPTEVCSVTDCRTVTPGTVSPNPSEFSQIWWEILVRVHNEACGYQQAIGNLVGQPTTRPARANLPLREVGTRVGGNLVQSGVRKASRSSGVNPAARSGRAAGLRDSETPRRGPNQPYFLGGGPASAHPPSFTKCFAEPTKDVNLGIWV